MKTFHAVLLVTLALVLAVPLLSAQPQWALDKGSIAIGGNMSYSVAGGMVQGFNDKTSAEITPYFYFFTSPNIGVGGDIYLSSSSRKDGESSTTLGIGPSVLLAFADSSYAWYPYLQMGLLFATASESSPYVESGNTKSGSGYALELAGGATYKVGRHVGITVLAYYQAQRITVDGEVNTGKLYGLRVGITGFIF
jgi:Outer membrane protein beta-barrel domain